MNLAEIAHLLGNPPTPSLPVNGVSIDSRQLQAGNLFIALRGEQFDGHNYILAAAEKGAVAIVCERPNPQVTIPQLVVADPLNALAMIASYHRQTINCPIIALTGSNGKTTVKEMIAAILPQPAHATPGNFNNHIGAPLSVLQLNEKHRYAVFELGANHLGEIAYTVAIVKPQVTLINNIAPAHIEGFGSIEGVAQAKGEIHQGLVQGGTAIINDDDDYAHFWDNLLRDQEILRFSLAKPVDVYAEEVNFDDHECASFKLITPQGKTSIKLRVPGLHNVRNALAAAACCHAIDIPLADIARGLQSFKGVAGRMTFLQGKNHSLIIDDTYNANLRSVLTAVDVLAKRQGQRILVLGDLGELGQWTQQHHEEIGYAAKQHGIESLMTCGHYSEASSKAFGGTAKHYTNQAALTEELLTKLDKNTTVLVKGSRSAAMEKIVHQLVG